jgi:hypothetical protein
MMSQLSFLNIAQFIYLFILFDRKGQLLGHETGLAMPDPKFNT